MTDWAAPSMFQPGGHGNKPFSVRIPSLLVSCGPDRRANFMTAMWFTAAGAEPSRLIVAIQKKSLSYQLVCATGEFVMSAPPESMMDVIVFAGRISGHKVDKWAATGLTQVQPSKVAVPLIGEALGNVEYRVVQQIPYDDDMDLFVGEVLCVHMRHDAMDGELYTEASAPLLYMGTKYDENGRSLGKHYGRLSDVQSADYDSPLLKKYIEYK